MNIQHDTCIEIDSWDFMEFNITIIADVEGGEEDTYDTPGTDTEATLTGVVVNTILIDGSPVIRENILSLFLAFDKICFEFVESNWSEFKEKFQELYEEEK
jgi:hypothetical protein